MMTIDEINALQRENERMLADLAARQARWDALWASYPTLCAVLEMQTRDVLVRAMFGPPRHE